MTVTCITSYIHNPFSQPLTTESLPHTWPWLKKMASTTPQQHPGQLYHRQQRGTSLQAPGRSSFQFKQWPSAEFDQPVGGREWSGEDWKGGERRGEEGRERKKQQSVTSTLLGLQHKGFSRTCEALSSELEVIMFTLCTLTNSLARQKIQGRMTEGPLLHWCKYCK